MEATSAHPRPESAGPARGTAGLLRDRTFGRFWAGNLVSNTGAWVHNVSAAVVVFELTGSATWTGAVTAALWTGSLLFTPYAGAISDRVDRRRMLIAAQLVAMASATALVAISLLAGGAEQLAGPLPIVIATFGIGLGVAFSMPAMLALVPALVRDSELEHAVALNAITFNLARAVGPALAAAILLLGDAVLAFAVNALSYSVLIGALLTIRPREVEREGDGDGSVRAGLRYVRSRPTALLLLLATAGVGIASDPVNTLTPALADELGGGEALVGLIVACFGAGAATAAALNSRIRGLLGQRRTAAAGGLGLALGITALALAPLTGLALVSAYVAGGGFLTAVSSLNGQLNRLVGESMRGRVMAFWGLAFLGTRPLSALTDGALADLTSPEVAGVTLAGFGLLTTWAALRVSPEAEAGEPDESPAPEPAGA